MLSLIALFLMTSPVESSSVHMPGAPFPAMRLSAMVTLLPTVLIPPASKPARATPTPFSDTVLPSMMMSAPPPPMPSRPLSRTLQSTILIPDVSETPRARVLPYVEPLEPPGRVDRYAVTRERLDRSDLRRCDRAVVLNDEGRCSGSPDHGDANCGEERRSRNALGATPRPSRTAPGAA